MTLITRSKDNGTIAIAAESVADILERELDHLIHDWMTLVEKQEDLMAVSLSYEERTGHLPKLLQDLIARLRLDAGTKAPVSIAATRHAELRREQGYSVAMVVEESRLLQVSRAGYRSSLSTSRGSALAPPQSDRRQNLFHSPKFDHDTKTCSGSLAGR